MTKHKFNLVGDSFTHLTGGNKGYSVAGKECNAQFIWEDITTFDI